MSSQHAASCTHLITQAAALADAQRRVFGGALAYAVVRRWGDVERYPHCLSAYWAGAYAVASWAAHALRLPRLPADTVVLRTRPDILWEARHGACNKACGEVRRAHSLRAPSDLMPPTGPRSGRIRPRAAPGFGHPRPSGLGKLIGPAAKGALFSA